MSFETGLRRAQPLLRMSGRGAVRGIIRPMRSAELAGFPACLPANGFTLVELVVALFVFGLLASAGVALLGFSVRAQAVSGERLDKVAAIRRVSALMTADLAQAAPRISRSVEGTPEAAFVGTAGGTGDPALAFVRHGWENPNELPRASLQKVRYRLLDGRLERRAAPMLDGAAFGSPATLIRGVRSMTLRYRIGGEWRERWDAVRPDALPRAVEVVLDVEGIGRVRQVFQAGTGL
jgi:general secretion pathway protein J